MTTPVSRLGSTEPLAQQLLKLIETNLLETAEPLTPESNLFDAGLDSLGIMQLLILIDENFGVQIDAANVSRENFVTATALAELLERLR